MSLPGIPQDFPENPPGAASAEGADVLSELLESIHLSGSVQFCFMPRGDWRTDAAPSLAAFGFGRASVVPFHIVAEGQCWLDMQGQRVALAAGDVILFPQGTGHQLGAGTGADLLCPIADLPLKPWHDIPVLRYGRQAPAVRVLCGFLRWDALGFAPLRQALPELLHVRTGEAEEFAGLRATIGQMIAEIDRPRPGGYSVLRRLTEIVFVQIMRTRIMAAPSEGPGWLAALAEPALVRCLSLIHGDPYHDWSLGELALASGKSRSALTERFCAIMGVSPVRYLREWRLHLASVALAASRRSIAEVSWEAGYMSEAAFNRAFARVYGMPPARWRSQGATPSQEPALAT